MRNHQNTILAMKASTFLMSISAMVLVVLLLTSNAVAKQTNANAQPDVVIADTAPIATPPGMATVPNKPSASRLVVVRIVQVVATAQPPQAAAIGQPAPQSANAQPAQAAPVNQPVAKAAAKSGGDQLSMPKLAAIPDVPVAQAAPAQNNGGGGGGNKSQPASKPAPKPQPAVTTKTS